VVDPSKGMSLEHRNRHRNRGVAPYLYREGQVKIEGTKGENITLIFDFKTTSQTLADDIDISVANGNEIILTV
jgi:hypothetical protein